MLYALVLFGSILAGQAAIASAEGPHADVRRLIGLLDSPQLKQREAAEAELIRLGPSALELLPPIDQQMSAEVQLRLNRVSKRLQQAAAEDSLRASVVTLTADTLRLSEILSKLQKQSGNQINDLRRQFSQPESNPELTINFNQTPFFTALDQVCTQAGLELYPYGSRRAIGIVAAGEKRIAGRVCYSGPFRIEPVAITARRDLRRSDAASLILSIEAAWEPRLRVVSLTQTMGDVSAVDQRGAPLPTTDPKAQLEAFADANTTAVRLELPFQLPPRESQRIAKLQGALWATIAGQEAAFHFDKLTQAGIQQKRIAHAVVTLQEVRKSGDYWEVRIEVGFDEAAEALASHRQWIFDNPAFLETPDGKTIAYESYETTAQGQKHLGLAYMFRVAEPLDKLAFVYRTPVIISSQRFDYQLRDIELP